MINLKTENWSIKNIDTILFDKDGTFIDLHYFWGKMTELRVREIISTYNLDDSLFSQLCMKLGYDNNSGKMLKDGITALYSRSVIIDLFRKDLAELGLNVSVGEMENLFDYVSSVFYKEMTKYTKPIDSALDFIRSVRTSGVKTGVVTSDSVKSTMLTLKHFKWEPLFDVVIGRESTKETKESGVPVKMALKKLGSDKDKTIMIGDAPMDYLAAKNAGVESTVLVATGQLDKADLLKTSPFVVDSLGSVIVYS